MQQMERSFAAERRDFETDRRALIQNEKELIGIISTFYGKETEIQWRISPPELFPENPYWKALSNAFGHWFGYVCPRCHQVIPCLWNIFSLAVLAITYPLWYFPVRFFRQRWLEIEKKRMAKVLERPLIQVKFIHWTLIGVFGFGGLSWVILEVIPQVREVFNGGEWDLRMMFIGLFIWMVGGFAWGLWMHLFMNRKGKKGGRT